MLKKGWLGFALVLSMLLVALAMVGCGEDALVQIEEPTIDAALPDGSTGDSSLVDATTDADASTADVVTDAQVSDVAIDTTPTAFNVASAASTSSTRVTVTFDAPPNPALAVILANYTIPGLTLSGTPSLSGNTVSLTTSVQAAQSYTVTAASITRASDAQGLTTKTATFTGRAPFKVASAASTSAVTLTVTFDAPPNVTQATALANYTVPGLTLTGTPVLAGNTVTLTTSTQSATSYTVTVAAVTRASDGEPLSVATATFTGTSTFNVASAAATDNTTVAVTFDAAPNAIQAADPARYTIPGLTVTAASLVGNVVSLTTSAQAAQSYTVTVGSITRTSDGAPLATNTATFAGRTTFNVVSAVSTSASSITVTFDAPPNGTQAVDPNNYAVPGLTLSAPVLSGITVKFTTTAQTATSYTLTVTGVNRGGDGQALTTNTATFTGRTPFDVTGAVANSVTVAITFDAPPNTAQATTLANYAVSGGLVLTGTPALNGNTVTITTSAQLATTYTVTVSNVGRASDGEALTINSATFTGFPRALLQITEVAATNAAADGFDFVELVALTGGRLDGLVVRESSGLLYTFGAFSVSAGERIVVHAGGVCVPANNACQDEDAAGMTIASSAEPFATATAWDVYSNSAGMSAADNVISVRDGATIVDAVALSNRDGDTSAANMTAFADLNTAGAWVFSAAPVDGTNDCAIEKDTASVATAATACGGQPTATGGVSLQRAAAADTNQKKDFYAAPQTRGLANGANPGPTVVSVVASSATGVRVVYNEDIGTGNASSFTIPALGPTGVASASFSDVNEVTLVTQSQTPGQGYTLVIDSGVLDLQSVSGAAGSYGFCGFSATAVAMVINEVAPNIGGTRDLVELRVTSGGAVGGITLRSNPTGGASGGGSLLATLPSVCAATGDIFVVHANPDLTTTGESETTSKTQFDSSTAGYSGNYNGAWDVKGTSSTVSFSETVLSLYTVDPPGAPNAALLDAVAFTTQDAPTCTAAANCATTSAAFKAALDVIENASQWTPACGGGAPPTSACDDVTVAKAIDVSARYFGVGTTPTGNTIARAATDTNAAADWTVGAQSLGAANP